MPSLSVYTQQNKNQSFRAQKMQNMQNMQSMQSMQSTPKKPMHESSELEQIFSGCFFDDYNTVLKGGADEPLYQPKNKHQSSHIIFYRLDYFASALHEVAHWCIAGEQRRKTVDYGYWYAPDGRDQQQQQAFEQAEVKPQAIEYAFSKACGKKFKVSIDNLSNMNEEIAMQQHQRFTEQVEQQYNLYLKIDFPVRAQKFIDALARHYQQQHVAPQL